MKKLTLFILTFLFLLKVNAQPCTKVEELNRKRHKVNNMTYGHPYTTFDRHNGLNFQQTIINVRQRILIEKQEDDKEKQPVYTAYKLVYEYAESTKPNDDGIGPKTGGKYTGFSSLAVWAKCNAFVFLVGLDVNGHRIDSLDSLNLLSNPSYYTLRKKYRDNALDALKHDLKGDANNITLNELQHLDRSLILWLQTYDMLKAACELPDLTSKGIHPYAFCNSDANLYDCSPRNKLRRLTRELYMKSKGYFGIVEHKWGWKKTTV
ncbi:MAG: hypothetical protein ACK4K9_08425 [Bacteroidia bacterium]